MACRPKGLRTHNSFRRSINARGKAAHPSDQTSRPQSKRTDRVVRLESPQKYAPANKNVGHRGGNQSLVYNHPGIQPSMSISTDQWQTTSRRDQGTNQRILADLEGPSLESAALNCKRRSETGQPRRTIEHERLSSTPKLRGKAWGDQAHRCSSPAPINVVR